MDSTDIPIQGYWQDLGRGLFADAVRSFARYGVRVAPDLALIFDDSLYSYYDRVRCVVSLPAPNADTLAGALMWCYYQKITGAESPEELTRFMRLALARFAAHELTHHLRHYYQTETDNPWLEEQVANTVGTAYAQSKKNVTGDDLAFLRAFLQRAKTRLQALAPTDAVTASYGELERVLVDQGLLGEADLEEARAFARVTRAELHEAVLAARVVPFETVDASLQKQRASQEYFNAHYMVNLVEYLRFQMAWFLSDLQRPSRDLGEVLQDYILTGDADRRHRQESLAFLTAQLLAGPAEAADLAALTLAREVPEGAEPILRATLKRREPATAGAALAALATLLDVASLGPLCAEGAAGPPALAARAAEVLYSRLGKETDALNLLRSLLRGSEPRPALEVVERLRLPALAAEVVHLLARRPDNPKRDPTAEVAWHALACLPAAVSIPTGLIRRGVRNGTSRSRASAVHLASVGTLSNVQWAQLLDDPSPTVREATRRRLEAVEAQQLCAYLHRRSKRALREAQALASLRASLPPEWEVWSQLLTALAQERALAALRLGSVGTLLPAGVERAVMSRETAARKFAVKVIGTHLPDLAAFWESSGLQTASSLDPRAAVRSLMRSRNPFLRAVLTALGRQAGIDWPESVVLKRIGRQSGFMPTGDDMALGTLEKVVFLKTVSLFAEVPTEELLAVADSLVPEQYQLGEQVCVQGQPGDALYIVIEGHLIAQHEEDGRPPVTVGAFGPGDCFGEMAVLDGEPRSATVVCVKDSHLLRLSGARFRELGEEHPELLFGVLASLVRRLRSTTRLMVERSSPESSGDLD